MSGAGSSGYVVTNPDGTVTRVSEVTGSVLGGVLHTAGNATLATAASGGAIGQTLNSTGAALSSSGLAGLPVVGGAVGNAATGVDHLSAGAANVTVLNGTLLGANSSGAQPLAGVSALSSTQTTGKLATVGLASGGNIVTANVADLKGAPSPVAVTALNQPVLGANGQPLVAVNLLSKSGAAPGSLATVGALNKGQTAKVDVNGLKSPTSALTAPVLGSLSAH